MSWIPAARERFTGLTWPHLGLLGLLAGAIGGVVAFWWQLDEDWFPLLALATGAIVIGVAVGLTRRPGPFWRKDDATKSR